MFEGSGSSRARIPASPLQTSTKYPHPNSGPGEAIKSAVMASAINHNTVVGRSIFEPVSTFYARSWSPVRPPSRPPTRRHDLPLPRVVRVRPRRKRYCCSTGPGVTATEARR